MARSYVYPTLVVFGNILKYGSGQSGAIWPVWSGAVVFIYGSFPVQKNDTKNKYANTALNYTKFEYVTK